jgi:hypothetical protein
MALSNRYVQSIGRFPEFFQALSKGEAPEQFTLAHLKDLGFGASGFRPIIPLLKDLGFLTEDGQPTPRYHEYRNAALSRRVLGQGLKQAYGDLFLLRSDPTEDDRELFEGKFKSAHNVNERLAKLMAATFFALLPLADVSGNSGSSVSSEATSDSAPVALTPRTTPVEEVDSPKVPTSSVLGGLNYNIQIHLPATKDVEVFNAIFKSLKEHFLA